MLNNFFNPSCKPKIWSFDIDGVLNNYPQLWLDYIYIKTNLKFYNTKSAKLLLKDDYKILKNEYRLSGIKYEYKISEEVKDVFNYLNKYNNKIIIATSRPFDKYPNMFDQTKNWLLDNGIIFNDLVRKFDTNYYFDIHVDNEIGHILKLTDSYKDKHFLLLSECNIERKLIEPIISSNSKLDIIHDIMSIII